MNARFALFAIAALTVALYSINFLMVRNGETIGGEETFNTIREQFYLMNVDWEAYYESRMELIRKTLPDFLRESGFLSLSALVLFASAYALYKGHEVFIRWRNGLRPLEKEKDPEFVSIVQDLSAQAGVSHCPTIYMAENSRLRGGQVFGFQNRYGLGLGMEMRALFRTFPAQFRAVILHEMTHITSADVGRTYFTQSLWRVVIFFTIVPQIVYLVIRLDQIISTTLIDKTQWPAFFSTTIPQLVMFTLQIGGTLALIGAIRASIIRAQEDHADWGVTLQNEQQGMVSILEKKESAGSHAEQEKLLHRLWSLHPAPASRLAALQNPVQYMRLPPEIAWISGTLLGVLLTGIVMVSATFTNTIGAFTTYLYMHLENELVMAPGMHDIWDFIPVFFAMAVDLVVRVGGLFALPLLITLILSIILGLNIQRDTIANLHLVHRHQSHRYTRLLFPAFLFALGWVVGFLIVPFNPINPFPSLVGFTSDNGPFFRILTIVAILLPLLACLIWIWFTFARYVTVRFLGSYPGDRPPTFISYLIIFALCPLLLQYFPLMVLFTLLLSDPMSDIFGSLFPDQQALFMLVVAAVAILFSANLIIDGLAFGCTWLFGEIWFRFRKRFCPACGTMIQKRLVVGRKCDHCNAELAVWPFVKP